MKPDTPHGTFDQVVAALGAGVQEITPSVSSGASSPYPIIVEEMR
jgi:hypothetical protein